MTQELLERSRERHALAGLPVILTTLSLVVSLMIAATAVSFIGVAVEFWRGRDYFLDKRIRDRALREAAVHQPESQLT